MKRFQDEIKFFLLILLTALALFFAIKSKSYKEIEIKKIEEKKEKINIIKENMYVC